MFNFIGQIEALNMEIKNLENKTHHLMTSNQILEGEVQTLRVQLEAKEKALEEAKAEAHLAISRLDNTEAIDRRQQRIDKLSTEVGRCPLLYNTDPETCYHRGLTNCLQR
jgi:regulator of replication initiation timing